MRYLLFTSEYPPFKGGVANYYGNLVRHFLRPDDICVLNDNDGKLLKPHWLFSIFKLFKNVRQNRIEHIMVGQLLPLGTVAYLVTRFTRKPYTVFVHGMAITYAEKSARKKRLARLILKNAKNIICESGYTAGIVRESLGNDFGEKVNVVNPGVSELGIRNNELRINELRKKNDMAGRIILFTVARLVKRKGQDKVIAAVKDLIQRDLRIHYYIAGAGPDREYLEKMAQGCANIHFLGLVSDEEKWAWLGACDIFVMPARDEDGDYEGFGIVYLEAALAGKPVIAGRAGGVAEAVLDGKTGLLVQGESVNEIKTAILRLAGDKELRERLGKTGKERAEREFGWERQIGKIYKIIN